MLRTPTPPAAGLALILALSALGAPAAGAAEQNAPQPQASPPQAAPSPAAQPEATAAPTIANETLRPGKPPLKPYLADAAAPDPLQILPTPPAHHSPLENADRAAFNTSRALKGSPRWSLATGDVAEGASVVLDTFACVLGTRIDQARVPTVINLLERTRLDLARATRIPKVHYRRLRPFVGNDAPICVQRTQTLTDSFSYPSGHATQGWAYALIMAALVPEKATAILARGRAYGESRIVCGVHWLSDVVAGRTNGAAVFAALIGDAGFRADLEKARAELAAAIAAGGGAPDRAICTRESEALREPALEL